MDEHYFYNALAIEAFGSYHAIKKMKKEHATWRQAFESLAAYNGTLPDPIREWKRLMDLNIHLVLYSDKDYPKLLREIPHPPFGIYVRGEATTLDPAKGVAIGIIGTRRATTEGKEVAKKFGQELARAGCTIISGLAFGIDAAGHEGCLDGGGTTVAVFAGGLDHIYPGSNRTLAEKILTAGGSFVSEYPLGEAPLSYRFIERNRIISGLSQGVLVIEAPDGSGSLATARFALEQNRDVFVVPGSISHPNFKGSHKLIRQGATLVTEPRDVLEVYGIDSDDKERKQKEAATPEEKLVLRALASISTPADVDKIIQMTRLEPQIANRALSFLLLRNLIKESGGGYTI
jgi:DNA processing protein